jgi:F-type H+-transporting ATPase subunit b
MLEINPGLIVWTIITFLIVLAILRVVAWKPLLRALNQREEKIRASLEQTEQARQKAQELLEQNKQQLALAGEQAQRIMKEGREMGEKLKNEIVERANTTSRQMIIQAKDEIQREKDAALKELRAEVADLAIGAAGKIIDANLDTPKQRKLVDSIINQIQKS